MHRNQGRPVGIMARVGRGVVFTAALMSPLMTHAALASGWGARAALGFAVLQAGTVGLVLWGALGPGPARFAAPAASAMLLAAAAAGAAWSPEAGLLASAGTSHAVLYGGLLSLFGQTLRPGRVPLVTGLARRINPAFHAGMEGYTRAVTVAWCVLFAGQIGASAILLTAAPAWWVLFVTTLHAPLVLLAAAAEYGVRRWRFRGQHVTGVRDSLRAMSLRSARRNRS